MKQVITIYLVVLAVYGFIEIFLQKKFLKKKSEKPDAGLLLILLPFYAALYLPIIEALLFNNSLNTATMVLGFMLFVFGFAFRVKGLMALKHNFSIAIECKDKSFLVTEGIYKNIRHPLYLSVVIMSISGCLIFSSIVCWAFYAIMLLGIYLRIEKEEAFLLQEFEDYTAYCKRSKKLIPFIY